jgi:hypothetical protein
LAPRQLPQPGPMRATAPLPQSHALDPTHWAPQSPVAVRGAAAARWAAAAPCRPQSREGSPTPRRRRRRRHRRRRHRHRHRRFRPRCQCRTLHSARLQCNPYPRWTGPAWRRHPGARPAATPTSSPAPGSGRLPGTRPTARARRPRRPPARLGPCPHLCTEAAHAPPARVPAHSRSAAKYHTVEGGKRMQSHDCSDQRAQCANSAPAHTSCAHHAPHTRSWVDGGAGGGLAEGAGRGCAGSGTGTGAERGSGAGASPAPGAASQPSPPAATGRAARRPPPLRKMRYGMGWCPLPRRWLGDSNGMPDIPSQGRAPLPNFRSLSNGQDEPIQKNRKPRRAAGTTIHTIRTHTQVAHTANSEYTANKTRIHAEAAVTVAGDTGSTGMPEEGGGGWARGKGRSGVRLSSIFTDAAARRNPAARAGRPPGGLGTGQAAAPAAAH